MYAKAEPLFPFGHGLSYTTFDYSDLSIGRDGDNLNVAFTLTNTGERDGEEVVQLYLSLDDRTADTAPRLKEFSRLPLKAGEDVRVSFAIPLSEAGHWDEEAHGYAIPEGTKAHVAVGSSSKDIRLAGDVKL